MRILVTLLGASDDAIQRAIEIGRSLHARGHLMTYLGEFPQEIHQEIIAIGADVSHKIDNQKFDFMIVATLAAPDRIANLASKLPSLLLVQQCVHEMMAMKGDFVHWITLFRSVKAIVFMTELQRDRVFSPYISGIDPARCYVLPCGPNPQASEVGSRKERDYLNVLMCGAFVPYMRQQDLIKAGERLREFKIVFNFIGDYKNLNYLPDGIKELIERHPERYVLMGQKSQTETLEIIKNTDVYCHTALDDAWSQAVMNSAAAGASMMLSDIEPFSSTWKNGINCLKFPVDSPDFLASSMRMLIQDDVLRSSLSASAKKTAKRFSMNRYCNQVAQLIEGLVK